MKEVAAQLVLGCLESTELSNRESRWLRENDTPGVTLFKRNLASAEQTLALTTELQKQSQSTASVLVAIDQEGGRVARIKDSIPDLGPPFEIEQRRTDASALKAIHCYGKEVSDRLAALGFNVNFAPVVDIHTEPKNLCIGDRCWADNGEGAALRAGSYLKGLEESGKVFGCLKHFPGQGDGKFDTHDGACEIDVDAVTLTNRELYPFKKLLDTASLMMTSHCIYPYLDHRPASLSYAICTDLLRQKLGYSGVLVSDDLTMGAISQDEATWREAVVEAIAAGCDLVLVCTSFEKWPIAVEAIQQQCAKSSSFTRRATSAAETMKNFRNRLQAKPSLGYSPREAGSTSLSADS